MPINQDLLARVEATADDWGPNGQLGNDPAHAQRVEESKNVDQALGLLAISKLERGCGLARQAQHAELPMPHDLPRFLAAQAPQVVTVLDELGRGRKLSHWMWYFFPQMRGLGLSSTAQHYGIESLDEAVAYLQDDTLGARLRECVALMLSHKHESAEQILGIVDAMKFKSSMTLFAKASGGEQLFVDALDQFYGGEADPRTLQLMAQLS